MDVCVATNIVCLVTYADDDYLTKMILLNPITIYVEDIGEYTHDRTSNSHSIICS